MVISHQITLTHHVKPNKIDAIFFHIAHFNREISTFIPRTIDSDTAYFHSLFFGAERCPIYVYLPACIITHCALYIQYTDQYKIIGVLSWRHCYGVFATVSVSPPELEVQLSRRIFSEYHRTIVYAFQVSGWS